MQSNEIPEDCFREERRNRDEKKNVIELADYGKCD
jgi:hypothetical protein